MARTIEAQALLFDTGSTDHATNARPFLKWAGGKGQLIVQYAPHLPRSIERYHEPFLGSGAVFFALRPRLRPETAFLSDANEHLVNCYQAVQRNVSAIIELLGEHKTLHSKTHYYAQREKGLAEGEALQRAARFIYFNKTCYNGLFRVNRNGHFNVPMGRYMDPPICDADLLRAASAALQGVDIVCEPYSNVLSRAQPGDYVYFDPPYEPLSRTSNFTSYTAGSFSQQDQRDLETLVRRLWRKQVLLAVSNSSAALIADLYPDPPYRRVEVQAARAINSKASARGKIKEFFVLNYRLGSAGEPHLPPLPGHAAELNLSAASG